MTDAEKISHLRTTLDGNTEADSVLLTYLSEAGQVILNRAYPYDTTVENVPPRYHILQCKIAAYLMNKRGAEGEAVHNENGVYRSYTSNGDIPDAMLNEIVPCVGVI